MRARLRSSSGSSAGGSHRCDHEDVSETLSLTVHFEDAGDGWVLATIPEVPGAISQGHTRKEARENVIDALRTVLTPDHQLAGQAPSGDDESLTLTIAPSQQLPPSERVERDGTTPSGTMSRL